MTTDNGKWTVMVDQLVYETREKKLPWSNFRPGTRIGGPETADVKGLVYEATYLGRTLFVFEYEYRHYTDEDRFFTETDVAIELLAKNSSSRWRLPAAPKRYILLDEIRKLSAEADDFADEVMDHMYQGIPTNQLLVADQQLGFVREYLPEPAGQVGQRIVQEGPSLERQDLIVRPGQDVQMVKTVQVLFTLARRRIGRTEKLVWKYDGDLHVDEWSDKDPTKLATSLKNACGALDLEVHSVGADRATVSAYFGSGSY